MRWIRLILILTLFAIGCSTARKISFDPFDMFFPDDRPLHEQYPANRPIADGKTPF